MQIVWRGDINHIYFRVFEHSAPIAVSLFKAQSEAGLFRQLVVLVGDRIENRVRTPDSLYKFPALRYASAWACPINPDPISPMFSVFDIRNLSIGS